MTFHPLIWAGSVLLAVAAVTLPVVAVLWAGRLWDRHRESLEAQADMDRLLRVNRQLEQERNDARRMAWNRAHTSHFLDRCLPNPRQGNDR